MGKHFNIRNQTFQWTDSVARMMSLRVILFVSLFYGLLCQNDSDSDSNCECSDLKLRDSRTNKMIGECLTAYRGRYWCYVNENSECPDKRKSNREEGLYVSFVACKTYSQIPYALR